MSSLSFTSQFFETPIGYYSLEEDNILYVVSKKTKITRKKIDENNTILASYIKDEPLYVIMDGKTIGRRSKDDRKAIEDETKDRCAAIAILVRSKVIRVLMHMYIAVANLDIPIQTFGTVEEGKDWLRMMKEKHSFQAMQNQRFSTSA